MLREDFPKFGTKSYFMALDAMFDEKNVIVFSVDIYNDVTNS